MRQKKSMLGDSVGIITDMAIGGAAMNAVSNSGMPQGFKDATNTMVGAGLVGKTAGRIKKWIK